MTFRGRLFFSFLLLAALIVAGSIFTVNDQFARALREDVFNELAATPERFAVMQASSMQSLITQSENLSSTPILRGAMSTGDRPTIREAAEEVSGLYSYDIFWVADVRGTVIHRVDNPTTWGDRIEDLPLIQDVRNGYDSGDLWLRGGYLYEVAASPVRSGSQWLGILIIGKRFRSGENGGLLQQFADLAHLDVAFAPDSEVDISSDPALLGFPLDDVFGRETELAERESRIIPSIPWHRTGPNPDMPPAPTVEFSRDNTPYAGALFSLMNAEGDRLAKGMIFQPLTQVRELQGSIRRGLLMVGVGAMLLALLVAWILSRGLTQPINRLLLASQRLGGGDLETPVPHQTGDEIGRLGRALDEMRISLRDARAEALRNEALSAIGRMASTITHDFRQPISSIYGYIQLITLPSADRQTQEEFAQRIIQQIDRMQGMINELLDYSRGEYVLRPKRVQLSKFLERVRENYALVSRDKQIDIEVVLGWDGEVTLDADRFERVLDNLVRNAVQAIESDGTVSLCSDLDGEMLELKVCDTGPGIPEEIRQNLFDAFVTHGKSGGTGLGLAVAKRVVEEHGGSIHVKSEVGVGTSFILRIPHEQPESGNEENS